MSTVPTGALPAQGPVSFTNILKRWRDNPKFELWLAWWTMIVFYNFFFVLFFFVTRVQPPPDPGWETPRVLQWFSENGSNIIFGFALIFIVAGITVAANSLIAYSIRRMSVNRAFAYSYLLLYSLSAVPGMLLTCIALTVASMRPDRDPEVMIWLYDFAFMAFDGTMGVFLIGSLIWMIAILIDRNRVFPKWFAYLNLCNALTEVVVAPVWLFNDGVFAWDGAIAWWIDVGVFMIYTGVFITLLKRMIEREDFDTGPLPA